MQTEENDPAALNEAPLLNPSSDVEMTVKEEIDYPEELPEKKNDLVSENALVESSNANFTTWENHPSHDFHEPEKATPFNNSFNTINHIDAHLLENGAMSNTTHERSAVYSTLPHTVTSTASSPSSQPKNERGRGRGRRRSRWKLKFHHQALPPEYLDHYEASMAQQEAAAAAAAAKSASVKAENRNKSTTTAKQLSSFSVKSVGTDTPEKVDKLVLPPTQCFVKLENEQIQFDRRITSSSTAAAAAAAAPCSLGSKNVMDQQRISPKQLPSFRSDDDHSQGQDEISIINEKPPAKSHQGNEGYSGNKGLLGTLLTSTITSSEVGNKAINENERKRKSVIISSLNNGNSNNIAESQPSSPGTGSGGCSNVRNYQDLPYMGEITLDNMKPRRGRKPKKADICHLIYKNYGTVLPGISLPGSVGDNEEWSRKKPQDPTQCSTTLSPISQAGIRLKSESFSEASIKRRSLDANRLSPHISHSDVQNRIISSLLEKRLTAASQEGKKMVYGNTYFASSTSEYERNNDNLVSSNQQLWNEHSKVPPSTTEEPLNLCVKDLNQLKIKLLRKHGNFYEPRINDVSVKSEPLSPSDTEETDVNELQTDNGAKFLDEKDSETGVRNQVASLLRNGNENNCESFLKNDFSKEPTSTHLSPETNSSGGPSLPGGYIYWPSAGVFVHPMALQSQFLYYQKMGAIPLVPLNATDTQAFLPAPIPHVNLIPHMSSSLPQNPQNNLPKNTQKKEQKVSTNKSLIPKAFSMMMDTSPKPSSSVSNEVSLLKTKRLAPLGTPPASGAPTKRKRSAIFIPPMPSENSTNPTTEVSICKFKFTGGAKPSLQEKKMLSVDSGGNFRYYSGTGDKSMRGYEFFPRETLQQSGVAGGSPSEQFLAASAASVGNNDKSVGNAPTVFVPEESTSGHMKHLAALTDSTVKVDGESVQCADSESGVGECGSSQNYESQTLSGCVRKKIDLLTKGRSINCGESDRYQPLGSEDDQSTQAQVRIRRKRKTRKSLAREKLEQTFKEKGFLIQTQQLESAEGATYCKFRQLRKFTRYLFRSWKDYLPGNVREMSVAAGVTGPDASPASEGGHLESEAEAELSCSNSPTPAVHVSQSSKSFTNI